MKKLVLAIQEYCTAYTIQLICIIAAFTAILSTWYFFIHGVILAYGDAESHINIAKRVISSLTPGLAQLGGIWLPLPHLLMIPFVFIEPLWRTGIAGSIVGGACYVISCLYIYKLAYFLLKDTFAAVIAFAIFAFNPNILYMQATPLSELPLIAFFILSSYYFFRFISNEKKIVYLILAAFFGFCATLSRYDGWFLVTFETISLILFYVVKKEAREKIEGKVILFSTLAFFGILLWVLWDYLILGDPMYFSNSPFSAKSQQQGWLARGELPSYKHIFTSFLYYFVTSLHNAGTIVFVISLVGLLFFLFERKLKFKVIHILIFTVPFIFYWATLYLGQAIIFIPDLTPTTFQWRLFNVRYGIMMIPFVAFFFAYLFHKTKIPIKIGIILLFILQSSLFQMGIEKTITLEDGIVGLSSAKTVDAQFWMAKNYDHGLILLDDYARTLSIIRSNLPIEKVIYIGNKPYWQESLKEPEKYATWIVLQKDDAVWNTLYKDPVQRGRLFKYFQKAYTSPEILIFKRNPTIVATK